MMFQSPEGSKVMELKYSDGIGIPSACFSRPKANKKCLYFSMSKSVCRHYGQKLVGHQRVNARAHGSS